MLCSEILHLHFAPLFFRNEHTHVEQHHIKPVITTRALPGFPCCQELVDALQAQGHPTIVAPLKFKDWLRLIPASLTSEYWTGELSPDVALPFYYEALEAGVTQLKRDYPDRKVQLVAHSIGGWITRAYLGQLAPEKRQDTFSALPHRSALHRRSHSTVMLARILHPRSHRLASSTLGPTATRDLPPATCSKTS